MTDRPRPLADVDGDPVFTDPWQAEALAMADALVSAGLFSASEWSETLGQSLREAQSTSADDQQTYYVCVLQTLERLISKHSDIDAAALASKRADWEQAYRSTPHDQSVSLDPP